MFYSLSMDLGIFRGVGWRDRVSLVVVEGARVVSSLTIFRAI